MMTSLDKRCGRTLSKGILLSVCLLLSSRANAETKRAKERAALKACLSGNVEQGMELLSDLYIDSRDPTYLYNQGRCYEQNHRYEDAIGRFREYLLKATNLSAADEADTRKHIATCQSYLRKAGPPVQPVPPPVVTTPPPEPPTVAPPPEPSAESDQVVAKPLDESPRRPGNHAGQLGLFCQFDRVFVPGISYGITHGLEIAGGALLGFYHQGAWLAVRYLFFDQAVKPGLLLAMPLFIVDRKVVVGVESGLLVQWDFHRHAGAYAGLGLSYFPGAAADLGEVWFVPSAGLQVRL